MTFRIRLSTPKSREIIEIPETWTLGTLKLEAGKRCKPKIKVKKNILLLTGYPPAPMEEHRHPDTQLARECLQPNDTIVVRVLDSKSKSKAREQKEKAVENNNGLQSAKKRSATSSSSTFASKQINDSSDPTPNNNTHSNKKKQATQLKSTSNRAGARKMARTGGEGRTLSGKVIAPPPKKTTTKKASTAFQMSSQEDVASQLLNSLNGNGGGKVGRFLRGAMRGAVGKSYEASRAQVRVAAVTGHKFEFLPHPNVAVAAANATVQKMQVRYSKGLEGRGNYTEDVDLISLEALKAVITSVYKSDEDDEDEGEDAEENSSHSNSGREMLRPVNMAQLSPRVFWSLAYHCPQSSDTIAALNALLPDLDWRYLAAGRSKTLSEKARENLRQERVRKGEIPDEYNVSSKDGFDAGASVVAAVEEAMMESHLKLIHGGGSVVSDVGGSFSVRDRMAKAALARAGSGIDDDTTGNQKGEQKQTAATCTDEAALKDGEDKEEEENWRIVTPDETDLDELIECIITSTCTTESSSSSSGADDETSKVQKDDIPMKIARLLAESFHIHNWRELANADASDLASKLSSQIISTEEEECEYYCKEEIIDQWIEQAQNRSMDEIMMELLDHREDVVIALRDEAKCGTPKDLSLWEAIPGVLLDAAPSLKDESSGGSVVSEEELRRYCARARCILDDQGELGWLEWFVTGIS